MFEIRKETDNNYRNSKIVNRNDYLKNYNDHNIWKYLKIFWFSYHSNIIESQSNLDGLRNLLKYENNDDGKNKCLNWLNNYIIFIEKNSTLIGKLKIFPNQKGIFELFNNLIYDESIPEILKDIYNKLFSTKEKQFEIRNILLCQQITAYKVHNKFTQEEIIALIEKNSKIQLI